MEEDTSASKIPFKMIIVIVLLIVTFLALAVIIPRILGVLTS